MVSLSRYVYHFIMYASACQPNQFRVAALVARAMPRTRGCVLPGAIPAQPGRCSASIAPLDACGLRCVGVPRGAVCRYAHSPMSAVDRIRRMWSRRRSLRFRLFDQGIDLSQGRHRPLAPKVQRVQLLRFVRRRARF